MENSEGEKPLHVACLVNDIDFVSWLFKGILAQKSKMDDVWELSENAGIDSPQLRTRTCLLYTSPSPRDATLSRMPSSA